VWVQWLLIGASLFFVGLFLVLPLVTVFGEAFRRGASVYFASFRDEASLHAIFLTLTVAAIVVPLNTLFGLAAAWAVARFKFTGRGLLVSFIELPLWVSPVISGLVYVLVFGSHGWWGSWLIEHNIRVIFALPGIVLATVFVTFPFVARCVIPQMEAQGQAEEEAALTLGAGGWRVFWKVTVPKIKWSLLYGIILCNARSMGEFGAVSVVSGHIRGRTNTLPLQIEILYNEYQFAAAFALASLLSLLALATLGVKAIAEARESARFKAGEDSVSTPTPFEGGSDYSKEKPV
jgi:sulfate transport system permease protein